MQAGSIPVRFSKKSPLLTAYSRTNCQQSTDPVLADSDAKRVSILKHIYSTLVGKAPIGSIPISLATKIIGLKVFMDARMPVTRKEGDRYPLGPPRCTPSL